MSDLKNHNGGSANHLINMIKDSAGSDPTQGGDHVQQSLSHDHAHQEASFASQIF
jgi:hypothetical protein